MSNEQRIELFIDIFEQPKQRAQALATLTPPELIDAVLQEFTELPYLGDEQSRYQLYKAASQEQLHRDIPLAEQVNDGEQLLLREQEMPLPATTIRPSRRLYLREPSSRKVFPIQWVPAIIGRGDPSQPDNAQVAVDLEQFPTGPRVSRRHAVITEKDGQFYVASLSANATTVKPANGADGEPYPIAQEPVAIDMGQRIHLERSGIDLQVIVRDGDR